MILQAKEGQSLVDIALMVTGATEGVWSLALRNGLSVTETLECGQAVIWEGEDIENVQVVSRYEMERVCPATEVSRGTLSWLLNGLIEKPEADYEIIDADNFDPESTRVSIFSEEFTATFA